MELTWRVWWQLPCLVLLLYITGIQAGLVVTSHERQTGNLGDTVRLWCVFSIDIPIVDYYWLKWIWQSDGSVIYAHRSDGYVDQATGLPDEDSPRFTRDNTSLLIADLKEYDARQYCCEVLVLTPVIGLQSCVWLDWTDFHPEEDFTCVDASGEALTNNTAIYPTGTQLEVECEYNGIYPQADLILMQEGSTTELQKADKSEATEADDRFSLKMTVNRTIEQQNANFLIRIHSDLFTRDFHIPVVYANSIYGGNGERRAMVGATVGIVVIVVIVVVAAVVFGYYKARQSKRDSGAFMDDTEKAPPQQQELVEKAKWGDQQTDNGDGLLDRKNGEATFDVHA